MAADKAPVRDNRKRPKTRDYFAEMYVAGRLAEGGWNVYFPHRDEGFDFIITKNINKEVVVRPVQVKGLYPEEVKGDAAVYGFGGKLTLLHPEMVLAIPFFSTDHSTPAPEHVAYMPRWQIKVQPSWGYVCQPGCYKKGHPHPRRDFRMYFDAPGIASMDSHNWSRQDRVANVDEKK